MRAAVCKRVSSRLQTEMTFNSPDDADGNLRQGVDERPQWALLSSVGPLDLNIAASRQDLRPEVDAVDELPIVHSSECVLGVRLLTSRFGGD